MAGLIRKWILGGNVILLSFLSLSISYGNTFSVPNLSGAQTLMTNLYAPYANLNGNPDDLHNEGKIHTYFSPALATLIDELNSVQLEYQSDACLNFDPIIDGDDWDISKMKMQYLPVSDNKIDVAASFANFGVPKSVNFVLVYSGAAWQINDVIPSDIGSLKQLLSTCAPGPSFILQQNVVTKLNALATSLDNQSKRVASAGSTTSGPYDVASLVPPRPGRGEPSQAGNATPGNLPSAKELEDYSKYLRALSTKIQVAPPSQIFPILKAANIPPSASVALAVTSPELSNASVRGPFVPTAGSSGSGLIPFIVNGYTTVDYPSVAALLYDDQYGGTSPLCTGTLIAPNVVLTARHCLSSPVIAAYFQHAGLFRVAKTVAHDPFEFPNGDLGLVFLKTDVNGITPAQLNNVKDIPVNSQAITVGYGYHSDYNSIQLANAGPQPPIDNTGVKLFSYLTTGACPAAESGKSLICWNYNDPFSGQGSTCEGDSGGPLFIQVDGNWLLAGVTAGAKTCAPGDTAVDVDVFDYADNWITPTIAGNPFLGAASNSPKPLLPITNPGRFVLAVSELFLEQADGKWTRSFQLPAGVSELRVGLDGIPTGYTLDLQVGPTGAAAQCDDSDVTTSLMCDLSNPKQGSWTVNVTGLPGQEVQVVATSF